MVTVPTVSPFCKPVGVNAVEPLAPVSVAPYVLFTLLAVIVKAAAPTIIFPEAYVIV